MCVSTWQEITVDWSKKGNVSVTNTKAHSHNHCFCGKALNIEYYVCVCIPITFLSYIIPECL